MHIIDIEIQYSNFFLSMIIATIWSNNVFQSTMMHTKLFILTLILFLTIYELLKNEIAKFNETTIKYWTRSMCIKSLMIKIAKELSRFLIDVMKWLEKKNVFFRSIIIWSWKRDELWTMLFDSSHRKWHIEFERSEKYDFVNYYLIWKKFIFEAEFIETLSLKT